MEYLKLNFGVQWIAKFSWVFVGTAFRQEGLETWK